MKAQLRFCSCSQNWLVCSKTPFRGAIWEYPSVFLSLTSFYSSHTPSQPLNFCKSAHSLVLSILRPDLTPVLIETYPILPFTLAKFRYTATHGNPIILLPFVPFRHYSLVLFAIIPSHSVFTTTFHS